MKKHFLILYLLFTAIAINLFAANTKNDNISSEIKRLGTLLYAIDKYYVDSIDINELTSNAIVEVLHKLDPHSSFLSKEEKEISAEAFHGSFVGIGVQYRVENDTILVTNTTTGCPAEKAGILPNDKIIFVGKTQISGVGMSVSEIRSLIRGPIGSAITLEIKRPNVKNLMHFQLNRGRIPINSVEAHYMINNEVGYIRINRFAENTILEVVTAIDEMIAKGMTKLVIDLEYNGGGYMNTAIELANLFIDNGKLILYTAGDKQSKQEFYTTKKARYADMPIAVVINKYSASASEIFSGAIQDWDRGIIVGERSFGKGLVQRPLALPDGSEVRLTIARYYTPSGRFIQKDFENNFRLNEDIKTYISESKKTLVLNRVVNSGNGILPDIQVKPDSIYFNETYAAILSNGIIDKCLLNYLTENKKQLIKTYKDFDSYNANFDETPIINDIKEVCKKQNFVFSDKQWTSAQKILRLRIKAAVAERLFENISYYYQIMNSENSSIRQATQSLNEINENITIIDKLIELNNL